jgi:fructokinase
MKKVFALGELLIDFMATKRDMSLADCDTFIKKAGGAPPNALAALCKLGGIGYLASNVGNDPFGRFLIEQCEINGIDTSMVVMDKTHFTTCAFVSLTKSGERDFIFARGADEHINFNNLNTDILSECEIFHFGAATGLLGGKTYEAYMNVLDMAVSGSKFVVFDPNYRQDFWKERTDEFIKKSRKMITKSHVIKASEQEARLLTGKDDLINAANSLLNLGAKIVLITLSDKGCLVAKEGYVNTVPSIKVNCIDATGAGDAFIGAFLYKLSTLDDLNKIFNDNNLLLEFVLFSNKAGAIGCTKLGAIEGMPDKQDMGINIGE